MSQKAIDIAHPFGLPVTNSMVVTWIVAAALILFARGATRNMTQVPGGAQNLLEWLLDGLYGFLKGILGQSLVDRTFWFFATIFLLILAANWIGLVPGVGSIGWGHYEGGHFRVEEPLFRGANADVNMTLAMARDRLAGGSGFASVYATLVGLATMTAVIPYVFCSLADGLIATRESGGALPRIGAVEVVAFAFSIFTVYGCGPAPVLWGLLLLLFGVPVYVWQRHERARATVAAHRAS